MPTNAEILEQQRLDNQSKIQAEIDKRDALVTKTEQANTASNSAIQDNITLGNTQAQERNRLSATTAAQQLQQNNHR